MIIRSLAALCITLVLACCMRHQYMTLTSDLPQEADGAFVDENDIVAVDYRFSDDGDFVVNIINKTDSVVYVDWNKSSIRFDDEILFPQTEILDYSEFGDISAFEDSLMRWRFIPPHYNISLIYTSLPVPFIKELKTADDYQVIHLEKKQAKMFRYDYLESPIFIKSKVHIYHHQGEFTIIEDFWVSDITMMVDGNMNLASNQLEKSRLTPVGGFGAVIGGLIYFTVRILLESE